MPQPANPSEGETAHFKDIFQGMENPAENNVNLEGLSPRQVQQLLPVYDDNAQNPTYGLFVDNATGKVYGFQSGQNLGKTTPPTGLRFTRGTLSSIDTEATTINFLTQEAHLEAQVSGFMRKHGIDSGSLYINASTPCLGEFGCNQNLPYMLSPGSRLRVFGTEAYGTFNGLPDGGEDNE